MYTTFFKHILIAFLSGTDVCAQTTPSIAFLKRDRSQSHTSPTENTHCKISSLALRRSAIIVFNGCRSCALHKKLKLAYFTRQCYFVYLVPTLTSCCNRNCFQNDLVASCRKRLPSFPGWIIQAPMPVQPQAFQDYHCLLFRCSVQRTFVFTVSDV